MTSFIPKTLRRWAHDEEGSITILSVYFVVIAVVVSGLAIDFTNRSAKQTKLQTAADAVGHAALYSRVHANSAEGARTTAMDVAAYNLPAGIHGEAIDGSDIEFGHWDEEAQTFIADPNGNNAVRVTARRNVERDNIVANMLLDAIGFAGFEVETATIFEYWAPPCFFNGFMARNIVDIQSNNIFGENFCMHGNSHVKISSDNTYFLGSVVSMPDMSNIEMPNSGFESNVGLRDALRNGTYQFNVIDEMDEVITQLMTGFTLPEHANILNITPVPLSDNKITVTDIEPGRIHFMLNCSGNQQVSFDAGFYTGFVLVTNCKVKFNQGVVIEDAVIATTNDDAKSFNAPNGLHLGRDDGCLAGGGVTLLTYGGFEVASDLQVYGSQVVAKGDITFAAQATGIEGVSMIAGHDVNTTSNIHMNGCPIEGMDNLMTERMVRMVQ